MIATTKFLIVDDDSDDREMFCEAIHAIAPAAVCYNAANGLKALTALQKAEIGIPDIIFLDINMPIMNGWQCLSKLKEQEAYRNVPVIIYSTSTDHEDVVKAQRFGAICFFSKPSNFLGLKKSLAIVVEHLNAGSLASLVSSSPLFQTTQAIK